MASRGKLQFSEVLIGRLKNVLWRKAVNENDEDEDDLVLAKDVSLDHFLRWLEYKNIGMKCHWENHKIIVDELTTDNHGNAIGEISRQIVVQDPNRALRVSPNNDFMCLGRVYESDIVICPTGYVPALGVPLNIRGRPFPSVVFEVGVSQTVRGLVNRANVYISPLTEVQIYIFLKRWPTWGDGSVALVAVSYHRQGNAPVPVDVISWGTASINEHAKRALSQTHNLPSCRGHGCLTPGTALFDPACTGARMELYNIHLPNALVFSQMPGGMPPHGAPPVGYDLDLFFIQEPLCEPL